MAWTRIARRTETVGDLAVVVVLLLAALTLPAAGADNYTNCGYTVARNSYVTPFIYPDGSAEAAPVVIAPRFLVNWGDGLVGQAVPVVANQRIFVVAYNLANGNDVVAFSEIDGHLLWWQPIPTVDDAYGSRTSPTVDLADNLVLMASGEGGAGSPSTITAMNMTTGAISWQTSLSIYPIVNSSVCITNSLALVADFVPGPSTSSRLWAVHVNGSNAGKIAWSLPLAGSSGCEATAVCTESTTGLITTDNGGYLRQVSLSGVAGWVYTLPAGAGLPDTKQPYGSFWSGLTVDGGLAYAATFNFYAGENSGLLVCLNAATGQAVWTSSCERTDSLPVVTPALVILSGGEGAYGSPLKIQAFNKTTGVLSWTWSGHGGWTMQPVAVGNVLYGGDLYPGDLTSNDPCVNFWAIDLTKSSTYPSFLLGQYTDNGTGPGSSPSYANGNIYTIGDNGLYAFGPRWGDINGDGVVDEKDVAILNTKLNGLPTPYPDANCDVNHDGVVTTADRVMLRKIMNGVPLP